MATLAQKYSSLLVDAQRYIGQEFAQNALIDVSPPLHAFFVERDIQRVEHPTAPRPTPSKPRPRELAPLVKPVVRPHVKRKAPPKRQSPVDVQKEEPTTHQGIEPLRAVQPPQKAQLSLDDLELIIQKAAPSIRIIDAPVQEKRLSPGAITSLTSDTLSPVALICSTPTLKERNFLENIARAITTSFFPCRVFEIAGDTPSPWPLLSSATTLHLLLTTQGLHQREPKPESFKGKYLILEEINLYFETPLKKAALWKEILTMLGDSE